MSGDTLTLYFIPYAYLTQCDLERTQGCSEKNNYNKPYGEQRYISANSLQENGMDTESFFLSKRLTSIYVAEL